MDLKNKTKKFRHWIVKKIAPYLYTEFIDNQKYCPRPTSLYIKKIFGEKPLIGVEIGVNSGYNAKTIFNTLNIKKLYLVDPYKPYIQSGKTFFVFGREKEAKYILKEYGKRKKFIKMVSNEAKNYVPDELDFVYIDGNHEYSYIKTDIENYFPKLKKGGVIGGHDYGENLEFFGYGVYKAVNEFAIKYELKVKNSLRDWWFRK